MTSLLTDHEEETEQADTDTGTDSDTDTDTDTGTASMFSVKHINSGRVFRSRHQDTIGAIPFSVVSYT